MSQDNLPDLYHYDAADDFSDMDASDIITPRLKFLQGLSKQVKKGQGKYGDLFNTQTESVVCPYGEAITVVFMTYWKEWVEWDPQRNSKKPILNRSTDPDGELARLCRQRVKVYNDKGKEVNKVTETYNTILLVPSVSWDQLFLMSFARTHHKVFKKYLNAASHLKYDPYEKGVKVKCPMFGAAWNLKGVEEGETGEEYIEPEISFDEFVQAEHLEILLPMASELKRQREQYKQMNTAEQDVEHDEDKEGPNVDTSAAADL